MYNIAIIGVGALGKRHLESILKSELPLQIYVVDNHKEAVNEAVKRLFIRMCGIENRLKAA